MATTFDGFETATALTGSEIIPIVQGGELKKSTAEEVRIFVNVAKAPKVVSTATYTLLETDVNNIYTNVAGCTITVPAGISLSHSSHHTCTANADLTFDADGTTINNWAGDNSSNGQYAVATLFQSSQDVFILGGNTKTV